MPHQLKVRAVITRDVLDAVGKLLSIGKELLQITETAGHRFTPRVDNARVRQHQVNEAQMAEVVRHLVYEEGLASTVGKAFGKVLLSQLLQFLTTHLRQDSRVAGILRVRIPAPKLADDLLDDAKLLGALDPGVRGEDLLDECGTGARQADDEYGTRILRTPPAAASKKLSGADFDLLLRIVLDDFGAIPAFAALQRVPELIVAVGLLKFILILPRLRERKTQMVAVDERCRRRRFGRADLRQLRIREPVGFEVCKTPVRVAEVGPTGRSAAIGLYRLLAQTERLLSVRD